MPEAPDWSDETVDLTPHQRHQLIEASLVTDPAELPADFLDRARARVSALGDDD